jgi:hypothetical protein
MCVTGSPIIEPVACTRVTTGLTCDVDTCSMGFGTCGSGRCQGTSACFSPCECNNNEPFGTCVDNGSPPSICAVAFR